MNAVLTQISTFFIRMLKKKILKCIKKGYTNRKDPKFCCRDSNKTIMGLTQIQTDQWMARVFTNKHTVKAT